MAVPEQSENRRKQRNMNPEDMKKLVAMPDTLIHSSVAKYCPGSAKEKAALASRYVDLKNRTRATLALGRLIASMHKELGAHEARLVKTAPPRIVLLSSKPN